MRKKFVYFIVIPALIAGIVVYLFIDRWVESGLEYAGEKAVGAKVEIDRLHLSLNPIGIEFSRLQVTNPHDGWKNLFETGKVKFALNFGQLLRGKFIIETMEMNDLIFGTKRTTDGSIPKPKEEETKTSAPTPMAGTANAPSSKSMPSFDIDKIKHELNIDSLLNPNNLATYRRIDTLKKQIDDASAQWDKSLAEIDKSKARLADIETRAKAIDLNNIKTLPAANDALNNIKSIVNSANDVKTSFTTQKSALVDGVNRFNGSIKGLDELAAQDFRNVVGMAHLPDVSMKGISEMVLGKDLFNQAYEYLGYAEMARTKIANSSSKPEIETPKRLKGQNIQFPTAQAYPKFWIKKILISGGTDKAQDPQYFYAKGEVLNITNDQRVTNVPLTVNLSATKGGTTTLALKASFDRRTDQGVDQYDARLANLPVNDMSLGQSDFLPSKITNTIADASISMIMLGGGFDSHTRMAFRNLTYAFPREPKTMVERVVHDVLISVKGFNVDLRLWKTAGKLDVAFTTDLDDQLASRTKSVIGNEVTKLQNDLRARLDAKIAAKRAEVEKLYNDKKALVDSRLKQIESQINEKLALVDSKKKEIDTRIDQEKKKQTNDATQKAKDALKGLFK